MKVRFFKIKDKLRDYFCKYGKIIQCSVLREKFSGKSRGFAFVIFEDFKSIEIVLSVKKHFICGKLVECKMAEDKNKLNETFIKDSLNDSMLTDNNSNLDKSSYNFNFNNYCQMMMYMNKKNCFMNNNSINMFLNSDFQQNNNYNYDNVLNHNQSFNNYNAQTSNDNDYSHHYKGLIDIKFKETNSNSENSDELKGKNQISEEINKTEQNFIYNGVNKIVKSDLSTNLNSNSKTCEYVKNKNNNRNSNFNYFEDYLNYKKNFLEPMEEFKDSWYMTNRKDFNDDLSPNFICKANVK